MATRFDAIVIGTGQAGPFVANRLARSGSKVAVIERGRFGGTCVNTGCIPTKTMVASAYAAHLARRAAEFGVGVGGASRLTWRASRRARTRSPARRAQGSKPDCARPRTAPSTPGHARFESANTVRVGGDVLEAERIFINVGGRAFVPDMPGIDAVPFLTNSSMMDVDFIPEHLVIIGGSYIGLEFGQMFRRFGSEVTIVEMGDRLLAQGRPRRLGGHPRDPRVRGHPRAARRQVHQPVTAGRQDRGARRLHERRAGSRGHAPAAGRGASARIRTILDSTPLA